MSAPIEIEQSECHGANRDLKQNYQTQFIIFSKTLTLIEKIPFVKFRFQVKEW